MTVFPAGRPVVDREQVRRDADDYPVKAFSDRERKLARHCLALLAELEQAERELRLAIERAVDAEKEGEEALGALALEPRLARVPALVEAASNAKSWIENYPLNADYEADWAALAEELGSALTTLEPK